MDQATYDRWWQLHLSVARGEVLESTERATYEAGLAVLDAEERAQFGDASLTVLRNLKAEVDLPDASPSHLAYGSLAPWVCCSTPNVRD